MNTSSEISLAAELIHRGERIVAFTGAGLSTASGIPDFRSAEDGLWTRVDPIEVASLSAFRFAPERFYDWARPVALQIAAAAPNPAHYALSALEQTGRDVTIVTQNIDDLHRRAGSGRVIEIHGNFRVMICTGCLRKFSAPEDVDPIFSGRSVPRCPVCSSVLKPGAILFGEELPLDSWQAAETACRSCDVLIVAGTSLEVYPAARLPELAIQNGASIISINALPTPIDRRASVAIRGRVETVLPAITAEVLALAAA